MRALTIPLTILVASTLIAISSGCKDDVELKACPSGGLGIKSTETGTVCQGILDPEDEDLQNCTDQMLEYKDYACNEPQVCPDQGSYRLPIYYHDVNYQGDTMSFALTNCSTGNEPLTISKIVLAGDSRCSMIFDKTKDVESLVVEPGEATIIRVLYKPSDLGEDHAALRITSNAENFPELVLPMCARAVPKFAPGHDSGMPGMGDGGADTGIDDDWICKDVGTQVAACHE